MSDQVQREATIVSAYYDEAKKAIVLSTKIDGIETTFQTPMPESAWKFQEGCIDKESEMRKTAALFNTKKGSRITLQFDGGQIDGRS